MLKELHIKNHESHKDTHLIFSKGVNTLIGASDTGKSSIIKTLYLLAFNRPTGDSFISDWASEMEIKAIFDDCTIIKKKGKENIYKLNGEKLKLDSGKKVPKQVIEALGLYRYNFSLQGDPHFMLSWSSGERASYLNDIMNLSIIDTTTKNIKGLITKDKAEKKNNKQLIKEYKKELKEYDNLDNMESDLITIEKLENNLSKTNKSINALTQIIEELQEVNTEIKEIKKLDITYIKKQLKYAEGKYKLLTSLKEKQEELEEIIGELEDINDEIKNDKKQKKQLEIKLKKIWPDECPLCGKPTKEI